MADFLSILIKLGCEKEGEKEKENNKRKENFLPTRALLYYSLDLSSTS
jgi:hypothetical protein